jgi:dihydrofolate reductase
MASQRVRVYIATSIDGFIAGPDDDLSWLDGADPDAEQAQGVTHSDPGALDDEEFIGGVGALLMGRRAYDVVRGFDVPWPYGERPVLVATRRPLDSDPPPTVGAVEGSITELIESAKEAAGEHDVYLDGGMLIRQAAEAKLIDELTITICGTE